MASPSPRDTLRLAVFSDRGHGLAGLILDGGGIVLLGGEQAVSCPLTTAEPANGTTVLTGDGCRLTVEAADRPATPAPGGGEQHPLAVRGTVSTGGDALELDARGSELVLPLPKSFGSARLAATWPDADHALLLGAARPTGVKGHDHDLVSAWIQEGAEATAVADPRLSVTTLAGDVPLRVGIELWLEDEEGSYDYPRRATGEVLTQTAELQAGGLTVEAHPVAWGTGEGRAPGLYAVVRPA